MNDTITVGSSEAEENSFTMYGVTDMKTGTVNDDGRLYVSKKITGEHVRYALLREGVVSSVGTIADGGAVEMNDVDAVDAGKILSNGALFVGSEYADEEITVVLKTVDEVEQPTKQADENHPKAQS